VNSQLAVLTLSSIVSESGNYSKRLFRYSILRLRPALNWEVNSRTNNMNKAYIKLSCPWCYTNATHPCPRFFVRDSASILAEVQSYAKCYSYACKFFVALINYITVTMSKLSTVDHDEPDLRYHIIQIQIMIQHTINLPRYAILA
jgi:hypothetical protein